MERYFGLLNNLTKNKYFTLIIPTIITIFCVKVSTMSIKVSVFIMILLFFFILVLILWQNKKSISKLVVFLTIISAFLGPSLIKIDIGPFSIFPYRVLIVILLGLFIFHLLLGKKVYKNQVHKYIYFLLLWCIYALVSFIWADSKVDAIRQTVFLFMGTSLILFIIFYLNKINDYKILNNIWLLLLIPIIGLGFWNNITGQQLSSVAIDYLLDPSRFNTPISVFYAENEFGTYLSLSLPFILVLIQKGKKWIGIPLLFSTLYLLIQTSSRANYLAVLIGLIVWITFFLSKRSKRYICSVILVFSFLISIIFPQQIFETIHKFKNDIQVLQYQTENRVESIGVRLALLDNCLHLVYNHYGFGVGAGNAEYNIKNYSIIDTNGITNPHNWWIEILCNYGIFIFSLYLVFYLSLMYKLICIYKIAKINDYRYFAEIGIIGLIIFIPAGISSSSIMAFDVQWLFFGFVLGFINCYQMNLKKGLINENFNNIT